MNLVLLKNISLVGVHWGRYSCTYTFYRLNQVLIMLNENSKGAQSHPNCVERFTLVSYCNVPFLLCSLTSPASRQFASGRLTPITYDKVYPFEKLTDGLAALEKRQTWGKAVVRIREEKTNVNAKL